MKKTVNINTIAKAVGMHKSTISRALKGSHLVNEASRKKILKAAKRLGYYPDVQASRLAQNRWQKKDYQQMVVCAYLTELPWSEAQKILWEPLCLWMAESGYQLVRIQIKSNSTLRSLIREIKAKGVQTVLLSRFRHPVSLEILQSPDFPWNRYTWVAVDEAVFRPPVHRVIFNHFHAMTQCLNQVYHYGYRRIAFIASSQTDEAPVERQEGAMLRFAETHPDFTLIRTPFDSFRKKGVQARLAKQVDAWLFSFPGIIDIINPELASLPYASLGLWPGTHPKIAGIEFASEDLYRSAVEILDLQFRHRSTGIPKQRHTLMVDNYWRDAISFPSQR